MPFITRFAAILATAGMMTIHSAYGAVPELPGNTDAARIERQLGLDVPVPLSSPGAPPQIESAFPVPGAEKALFFLKQVKIEGVTVYTAAELEKFYQSLLNKEISIANLYEVAAAITQKYRTDGYVFSRAIVPPQTIADGVAKISVIEAFADTIVVDGVDLEEASSSVKRILQEHPPGTVLNIFKLERVLLLLNDLPGLDVRSVIEPSGSSDAVPGALILRLAFAKERSLPSISMDNYGSRYIGPYQIGEKAVLNNLFDYNSKTTLQSFQTTQTEELGYLALAHSVPVLAPGLMLNLETNYSRVLPGGSLRENDLRSYARKYAAGLSYSVLRTRSKNLTFSGMLETRDTKTKILGEQLYHDKLTVLTLDTIVDFADRCNGTNILNFKIRKGLDILGARKTGSLNLSRQEGRSDFTTTQLYAARSQRINDNLMLYGLVKGQYSAAPLLSSEEFGYGGMEIGKAYNASEIVGDRGVAALAELRYNLYQGSHVTLQPYAFYDVGKVWNIDHIDKEAFSGASAGFGMRSLINDRISLDFTVAKPLTRSVETPVWGSGDAPAFKFSLGYQF